MASILLPNCTPSPESVPAFVPVLALVRDLTMAITSPAALRLVIAGGGTGGHVHPALAVIEELRGRGIPLNLIWIGSRGDVEGPAAERAGITFRSIQTGKLR